MEVSEPVLIGVLVTLILNTAAGFFWGGQISARVRSLETQISILLSQQAKENSKCSAI